MMNASRRTGPPHLATIASAAFVIAALAGAREVHAGGPLTVELGQAYRWRTTAPVPINPDRGPLGSISKAVADALVLHAVAQWDGVSTSALRVQMGAPLRNDLEGLTENELWEYVTRNDGTNPVIYDSDGSIIEALFGPGSGVLGAAGPSLVVPKNRTIIKGFGVFNGRGKGDEHVNTLRGVITHELGHMFNLDHSQVNGARIGLSIPGFSGVPKVQDVETMYPILVPSITIPHPMSTLHKDDIAALSALYPTPDYAASTGTLRGIVYDFDGTTRLQGVNVVARSVNDPFGEAISYITGMLSRDVPTHPASLPFVGAFELTGLTPGVAYKVYIEEVEDEFYEDGPEKSPLAPPRDLDPTSRGAFLEFYSGADEAAANPPDNPITAVELVLGGGSIRDDVDIVFNGVRPRIESVDPATGPYNTAQEITIFGANLAPPRSVELIGPEVLLLRNFEVVDASTLLVVVPAGLLPGAYAVLVTTVKGSNEPGTEDFRATEPAPTVTSISPDSLRNDRARSMTVEGAELLGTQSGRLVSPKLAPVDLQVLQAVSVSEARLEVPAGVFPGDYGVIVANTTGESPTSVDTVTITELPPVLSGEVVPPTGGNSGTRVVSIQGENLTGTRDVELIKLPDAEDPVGSGTVVRALQAKQDEAGISVVIRSTSLTAVQVAVPGGLEPGSYLVKLANSADTVTGPSTYDVTASSGGGGGGCAAGSPTGTDPGLDLALLLLVLLLGSVFRTHGARRTLRTRTLEQEETGRT